LPQKENIKHALRIAKQDGNKHPDLLVGVLMQESMLGEAKKYKVAGTVEKYYGLGQVKLRAAKEVLKEYPKLYSFLPNRSDFEIIKAMKNNSVFAVELASKYLIIYHRSFLFCNKKTAKLFSKLNRHIDIFISSSSVCSLSSLTIWKSSTPGITPSVLPLSKTQCTVPISSICSIFFVV
jgi:hypothetical protein